MHVQLYVYDLSQGLARNLSRQFLGTQIDAVYHTSLVIQGIEYYFGQGVQTCAAGATHHGNPIEIIQLGQTQLPMEIILEYLESLKTVYTAESYDLFLHNCNNFTSDFATFLVGKGIPEHITSLPQTVLNTPFGQMLKPQIDAMMRPITQAPTPQAPPQQSAPPRPQVSNGNTHASNGVAKQPPMSAAEAALADATGRVNNITTIQEVDRLLGLAKDRCAIIFFTSATCPPCKLVYQPYDDLAAESGNKCIFIKIDLSNAERTIGIRYPQIRGTPTFLTYLHGQQRDKWVGADPRQLRNNVEQLLNAAFPPHPHLSKSIPILSKQSQRPITYAKVPALDKLVAKMGDAGKDPAVSSIVSFIDSKERFGAMEAPLTRFPAFSEFLKRSLTEMPLELRFTALDLLRVTLTDIRVAGFFAEEHANNTSAPATLAAIMEHVNSLGDSAPYPLRLITLHLACNCFNSPLFIPHLLSAPLSGILISILTTALLDKKHPALKASALSLALNLASSNQKIRMKKHGSASANANAAQSQSLPSVSELEQSEQVELLASLLETLSVEDSYSENTKAALVCTAWLVYGADIESEVRDLWRAMDAAGTVGKIDAKGVEDRMLVREVKSLLEV